jgi:hypothetical protein
MSRFRDAAGAQTNGYPNALHRGYRTLEDARLAWEHAVAAGTPGDPTAAPPALSRTPVRPTPRLPTTPPPSTRSGESKVKWSSPTMQPQPSRPATPIRTPPASSSLSYVSTAGLASPSPRRSRLQTPCVSPNISYLSAPLRPLTDEELYWVVTEGDHPGVYLGR